jgi:hypothetical protein
MIAPISDGMSSEVGLKRDAAVGFDKNWTVGETFAVKTPLFDSAMRI